MIIVFPLSLFNECLKKSIMFLLSKIIFKYISDAIYKIFTHIIHEIKFK